MAALNSQEKLREKSFNANKYATKKTIAQGMLDVALLTSNASHLKLVLQDDNHPFYGPLVFLISLSILLQVRVLYVFKLFKDSSINILARKLK